MVFVEMGYGASIRSVHQQYADFLYKLHIQCWSESLNTWLLSAVFFGTPITVYSNKQNRVFSTYFAMQTYLLICSNL